MRRFRERYKLEKSCKSQMTIAKVMRIFGSHIP